jgi:effector-binding domain-containing protein
VEQELARTQSAATSLRLLLEGPPASLRITHRSEPAIDAAVISEVVAVEDLSPWFEGAIGELHGTLAAQGVSIAGPSGAVISNHFFSEERGEITIFLPAGGSFRPIGRVKAQQLPPVELATITHVGPHDSIDRAYGALATYVSERALGVEGPLRERYLVGLHDTQDQSGWQTEIGWPIFRVDSETLQ